MIRLAADENLDRNIVNGLRRRIPGLDIVRVQDAGFVGADDPKILEWTAREGRVLLTHDVDTMVGFAYDRLRAGKPMPGLVEIRKSLPLGPVIEDLVLLVLAGVPEDLEGQVKYLPL